MKSFIFILLLVLTSYVNSQIYSVNVNSVKMHIKANDVNYEDVVNSPDKIIDEVSTNTQHILNLKDSTCSFYYHGVYINTVPIVKFENKNNILHFTMADHDNDGLTVLSNFVIDIKNNNVFYYWFNEGQQVTKVEIKINFKITIM